MTVVSCAFGRGPGTITPMRRFPVLILALALLALLAVPAGASAAVRHAVPSGGAASGPCDAAAACTLEHAIAGAAPGATVRLAGGR